MKKLEAWENRPPEEANLYNPAFLGSLIFEFVKAFDKEKPNQTPMTLIPVALSIVLFAKSRKRLPNSTVTSFYDWVQRNEDLLIGFAKRTADFVPNFKEGLRFAILGKAISIGEEHYLILGLQRVHFPQSFIKDTSAEVKDIINKTKFVSRWLVKSGSETSILSACGVRL